MRWPIRNQILVPFAIVQAVAVGVISLSAAWLAADRAEREAIERLNRVVQTLSTANFPIRSAVLEQMKGLSAADFIAAGNGDAITASTLPAEQARMILSAPRPTAGTGELGEFLPVAVGTDKWLAGSVDVLKSPELRQLLVLIPERDWQTARRDAIVPPLVIGGIALMAMVSISFWLSARIGHRLRRMQQHVQRLASSNFDEFLPTTGHDELQELATSINRMAQDLQQTTQQIRLAERTTLVTQVAGGLAHQLRNSITGARMAVQLHLRRCGDADRESLNVALRQLSLTENQIRGLLRLTRDVQQPPVQGRLDQLLETARELLEPQCQHSEITMTVQRAENCPAECLMVDDSEQIQAAVLNLLQNAVEACGPGGTVTVTVSLETDRILVDVLDTGPGVADNLRTRLFEPFVTGKPEGVGLGLTLAAQAAEDHGGRLSYDRIGQKTRFRFEVACRSVLSVETPAHETTL
jgi:signal transduction histidine kinase